MKTKDTFTSLVCPTCGKELPDYQAKVEALESLLKDYRNELHTLAEWATDLSEELSRAIIWEFVHTGGIPTFTDEQPEYYATYTENEGVSATSELTVELPEEEND